MDYIGIFVLSISFIFLFFSWKKFQQEEFSHTVLGLILVGIILRIFMISDSYLHKWDERYHGLVAKNLISDPLKPTLYKDPVLDYDYKNWTTNHIWLHKQPAALWLIAASLNIFGINEFAVRIPSLIASTLGIYLMFLIGKILFDHKIGCFAAFLFSIHGLILELTGGKVTTDHIDVLFLFFIMFGIYWSLKFVTSKKQIYNIFCASSLGLAILTKWLPALIILPFWLFISQSSISQKFTKKELAWSLLVLIIIATIIALPWQIYTHYAFPLESSWEKKYNWLHIFQNIEDQAEPFYYHFNHMRIIYGELIYLPLIWLVVIFFRKKRDFKILAILLWIFIPYIFFSLVVTKMQAYTLIAAPAIFLISALFWRMIVLHRNKFKYKIIPNFLILGLIFLPLRYSIERIKPLTTNLNVPQWRIKIDALKKIKTDKKLIIFNTDHPIETMFHIDCVAYEFIPDQVTLKKLEKEGFKIVIQ